MTRPVLSICIPTYNRARYLAVLLGMLQVELPKLPFSYEVIVSDNASTDNTAEIVGQFSAAFPIRYVRSEVNIGAVGNYHYSRGLASGEFSLYLADDDMLEVAGVIHAIYQMQANPDIGVLYAPWLLCSLVTGQVLGRFYEQSQDIFVPQGDYAALAQCVVENKVFPEISLCRTDVYRRSYGSGCDLAFWAFTNPCAYLSLAGVMFASRPFYISITQYFADEVREQQGTEEVEYAWDRYRGGLEYMLGKAGPQLSDNVRHQLECEIEEIISERMQVALRLRLAKQRPALDSYYLACRLRGRGVTIYALPLEEIRLQAIIEYLVRDVVLSRGKQQIAYLGDFPVDFLQRLVAGSVLPVEKADECLLSSNSILLLAGEVADYDLDWADAHERNISLLAVNDLFRQFN